MRWLPKWSAALVLIIGLPIIPYALTLSNYEHVSSFGTISYGSAGSLPRLEVAGNEIQFINGTQVWLKGVNLGFATWWYAGKGTQEQIQYIASWNCNVIRFTINPLQWTNDPNVRSKMDDLIEWSAQEGMYSMIDNHYGYPSYIGDWTSSDWQAWRDWWVGVATRYDGNTNVLYDLLNEPVGVSASKYQTEIRATIDAVRNIDSDVICIVEAISENTWYDVALNFEQTNPISRSNIVFEIHKYYCDDSWEYSKTSIRNYLTSKGAKWLVDNNRVAMTGEFNYDLDVATSNGATWMRNWMEVMNEDGYSGFKAWWWDIDSQYRLLADWNGNPSASGLILQEYLTP